MSFDGIKRAWKAVAGSVIAGVAALATAKLTGTEPDPDAVQALGLGIQELAMAAFWALLGGLGVYKIPNQEPAEPL